MKVDGLTIDPLINNLILSGAASTLTPTEHELLYFLAQRPGQAVTRGQIKRAVKGGGFPYYRSVIRCADRAAEAKAGRLRMDD